MSGPSPSARTSPTLLVGWDGADYGLVRSLIQAGLMPCTRQVLAAGSSGVLHGFAPDAPALLWTTLATGMGPAGHGIIHYACSGSAGGFRPVSGTDRGAPAIWEMLSAAGRRSAVIGWPCTHPAEAIEGAMVSDAWLREQPETPQLQGGVHPPDLLPQLAELRLGRTNIDARLLHLFIPRLTEIDRTRDHRPAALLGQIAQNYSTHNAAIRLARDHPDFLAVRYPLIATTSAMFLPFLPPPLPGVPARQFELYREVFSSVHRLLDQLLADLLHHFPAGTNLLIVSPRGLIAGGHRSPAAGARPFRNAGFLAASGPSIRPAAVPEFARIEDIAPSVLALQGVQPVESVPMAGRVLTEIFRDLPSPTSVSYSAPVRQTHIPRSDDSILLAQLAQHGLIHAAVARPDAGEAVTTGVRQAERLTVGTALLERNDAEAALPHLHRAWWEEPEHPGCAFQFARALLTLGLHREATAPIATLEDFGAGDPGVLLLRAQLALQRGRFSEALAQAQSAGGTPDAPSDAGALLRAALIHLRRFHEARRGLLAVAPQIPDNPWVPFGLALIEYLLRNYLAAAARAREALKVHPGLPAAQRLLERIEQRTRRAPSGTSSAPPIPWQDIARRADRLDALRRLLRTREEEWSRAESIVRPREMNVKGDPQLIVAGIPRSGTSLLMRMLAFGGARILADGVRPPDASNPAGYYEWSLLDDLPQRPGLIDRTGGKIIKLPSHLVAALPADHRYRILWVRRELRDVLASQAALRAAGREFPAGWQTEPGLAQHRDECLRTLRTAAHVELLEVDFEALRESEPKTLGQIAQFIGQVQLPRPQMMPRGRYQPSPS